MSLILKGIDLPAKENEPLKLEIYSDGGVWVDTGSDFECRDNAAVQLKRPHGRIVDIGEYKKESGMQDFTCDGCVKNCDLYDYTKRDVCIWLDKAPTILEAEETDENQI